MEAHNPQSDELGLLMVQPGLDRRIPKLVWSYLNELGRPVLAAINVGWLARSLMPLGVIW